MVPELHHLLSGHVRDALRLEGLVGQLSPARPRRPT